MISEDVFKAALERCLEDVLKPYIKEYIDSRLPPSVTWLPVVDPKNPVDIVGWYPYSKKRSL